MNLSVSTIFLITVGWCEAVTMTGYLGGRANIYCRYPSHTSRDYKHIYKQTTVDRSDCVASTDPGIVNQDRFSINDDTLRRVATVTISSVSVSDSGEYRCEDCTSYGSCVTFERVKFWAIPLTGYTGGEVQMKCPYESKFEKNTKYLQKLGSPTSLVQTEDGQIQADNGRFSLYDDTKGRELMVNIRGLQAEDSGKYRCGIKDFSHREWPLAVKNVISVSGFEGHTIDISCKYRNMSGAYRKHFCQGTDPKKCLEEGLLTQDRVCLRDNAADQVFTVAMSNFQAEDAGIYWCVAINDISRLLEFTSAVQLTVKSEVSNIMVSVIVSLALVAQLLGLVIFVVCRKRRSSKKQDHSYVNAVTNISASAEVQANIYQSLQANSLQDTVYQTLHTSQLECSE